MFYSARPLTTGRCATPVIHIIQPTFIPYYNMTPFFRFVNKRASYPFGIISLAHAPVNVTDFSIGNIDGVRHFPQA
jgi:hypothetical protein